LIRKSRPWYKTLGKKKTGCQNAGKISGKSNGHKFRDNHRFIRMQQVMNNDNNYL
jgi:hypothetical protein